VTCTSAPCTSIFHPVRIDGPVDQLATLGPDPTNRYDPASRWWAHELLHRRVLLDHDASSAIFAADRDAVEREWIASPPSTAVAVAMSAEAEQRWLAALVAADLLDLRLMWLRDLWHDLDAAAGLSTVIPSA